MLFVHAPAWAMSLAAWVTARDPLAFLRWGLLSASLLLFVLKLLDVPWLRIPRDPRARVTVILMLLLAHSGAVPRLLSADFDLDTPQCAAVLAVGAGLLGLLPPLVRRVLDSVRPRATRRRNAAAWRAVLAHAVPALLTPRYLQLAHPCPVNRAPPA